ncbi:MAG TPA: hypothetical protein VMV07_13520 [Streptosporangiaceae bacterium]|nr:hypothetical protein [Streptosporangiaceae bacterium]
MLDRANPLQKPQSFVGSDSTTVPAGLIPLMDNQHILVAAVLASSTYRVPQGPLYRFLMANGAGTVLATVENLNTGMACGIRCMFSYVLVSVAGGNEGPGIEYLDLPAPLTYAVSTSPEAGDQHYSGGVSFAVFELVQMDGGLYFPTRSLYPTGG